MISTTTSAIDALFREAILGIDPTETYKDAQRWSPYQREVEGPSTTRRFRLVWSLPTRRDQGIFTHGHVECEVECRVRTDYAGDHSEMQHLIIEDHHQLCETLAALKSPSNGIMLVERLGIFYQEGDESEDVSQIDHSFQVRYLRAR